MKTLEKPELEKIGTTDKRRRHIVERIGPSTSLFYKKVALCGEEVTELVFSHSDDICQKCVDELRTRR